MSKHVTAPEEDWANEHAPKVLGVDPRALVTTQLFTIIDEYDEVVIRQIIGLYNHKNAKIILDAHSKGVFENAHKHIINMCFALVSVNTHRRNYHSKIEESKKRATEKMASWNSPYETAIYDQDITVEVVGALINLKTALDSLAQAIAAIYKFRDLKTWKNNGDGVIKALKRNVPENDKQKVEKLNNFIEKHQTLTRDYIGLRDTLGHGMNEYKEVISGFFKRKVDDEVQRPRVQMGEKVIDCGDLVDGCAKIGSEYCREVVAIILSSVIPGFEVGNKDGEYMWTHNIVVVQDLNSGKIESI